MQKTVRVGVSYSYVLELVSNDYIKCTQCNSNLSNVQKFKSLTEQQRNVWYCELSRPQLLRIQDVLHNTWAFLKDRGSKPCLPIIYFRRPRISVQNAVSYP